MKLEIGKAYSPEEFAKRANACSFFCVSCLTSKKDKEDPFVDKIEYTYQHKTVNDADLVRVEYSKSKKLFKII